MNEKSSRNRNRSKDQQGNIDRAVVAARDSKPGAINRPGFDLGGATGDAKPDNKTRIKHSTVKGKGDVKEEAGRVIGDPRSGADKVTGKMRSAVAGVRNWLRRK